MSSLWIEQFQAARQPEPASMVGSAAPIVVPHAPGVPRLPQQGRGKASAEAVRLPRLMVQVLEVMTQGLALLDADGQVLYANGAAVRACAGTSSLRLHGEVTAAGADGKRLARAVERAVLGRWSMLILGGTAAADNPDSQGDGASAPGAARRVVGLVPLNRDPACPEPAVLLVIGGEPGASDLALHFFCEQFGVTKTERSVLLALGQGLKPADIARDRGVALCTVRTQVAQLRQKVDVPDIGQLLRVLLSLPPVAQPLQQGPWYLGR